MQTESPPFQLHATNQATAGEVRAVLAALADEVGGRLRPGVAPSGLGTVEASVPGLGTFETRTADSTPVIHARTGEPLFPANGGKVYVNCRPDPAFRAAIGGPTGSLDVDPTLARAVASAGGLEAHDVRRVLESVIGALWIELRMRPIVALPEFGEFFTQVFRGETMIGFRPASRLERAVGTP